MKLFKIELLGEKGRGLVSTQDIPKRTLVESSPVLLLPLFKKDENKLTEQLNRYVYYWSNTLYALALGYGSLINHDNKPNLSVKLNYTDKTIEYYALRDIVLGEELTIDYGRIITKKEIKLGEEYD